MIAAQTWESPQSVILGFDSFTEFSQILQILGWVFLQLLGFLQTLLRYDLSIPPHLTEVPSLFPIILSLHWAPTSSTTLRCTSSGYMSNRSLGFRRWYLAFFFNPPARLLYSFHTASPTIQPGSLPDCTGAFHTAENMPENKYTETNPANSSRVSGMKPLIIAYKFAVHYTLYHRRWPMKDLLTRHGIWPGVR